MEKKLTIIKLGVNKDGSTYEDGIKELVIKPFKPFQFITVTKILKDFINLLNEDENVTGTLSGIFDNVDVSDDTSDILQNIGAQFIKDGAGTLGFLLDVAPEKVFELIAVSAKMSVAELEYQELDTFFDIVDAVIEVNDIEKVISRVKSSANLFGVKMGWKTVTEQATAPKIVN